jgi:hypothetical protein
MHVSECKNYYKFVLSAGALKNRDKLIDPAVRVAVVILLTQFLSGELYYKCQVSF